jgi:hypothetical protein
MDEARPKRGHRRWLWVCGGLWLGLLLLPVATALRLPDAPPGRTLTHDQLASLLLTVAVSLLATLCLGAGLGHSGRWLECGVAAMIGAGWLAVLYVYAMYSTAPAGDSTVDNAAGAGLVLVVVPASACLTGLLFLAAGIGWSIRRLNTPMRRRSKKPSSGSTLSPHL